MGSGTCSTGNGTLTTGFLRSRYYTDPEQINELVATKTENLGAPTLTGVTRFATVYTGLLKASTVTGWYTFSLSGAAGNFYTLRIGRRKIMASSLTSLSKAVFLYANQ